MHFSISPVSDVGWMSVATIIARTSRCMSGAGVHHFECDTNHTNQSVSRVGVLVYFTGVTSVNTTALSKQLDADGLTGCAVEVWSPPGQSATVQIYVPLSTVKSPWCHLTLRWSRALAYLLLAVTIVMVFNRFFVQYMIGSCHCAYNSDCGKDSYFFLRWMTLFIFG